MSYDVSLQIDTGRGLVKFHEPPTLSSSYNVALLRLFGITSLRDWHGREASELIGPLDKALFEIAGNMTEYISLMSHNDGGQAANLDNLVGWFYDLRQMCAEHPACIVCIY